MATIRFLNVDLCNLKRDTIFATLIIIRVRKTMYLLERRFPIFLETLPVVITVHFQSRGNHLLSLWWC